MKKYISDMTCLWLALITIGCEEDVDIEDVDVKELISKYEQSAVNLKCDNADIGTVTCKQEGGHGNLYVCKPKKSEDNPNKIAKAAVSEKFMECPGGCDGNKCAKTNTQLEQCDDNTHLGDVICIADKSAKAKLWACQKEGDNKYNLKEIIECPSGKCDGQRCNISNSDTEESCIIDGMTVQSGEIKCINNELVWCNNGVTKKYRCPSNACNNDECADPLAICTNGDQKCENNAIMKCNGNKWDMVESCGVGCMQDKTGNPSCIECIDGPIQCDAERLSSDDNIFFKFKATSCKDGKWETEYCGEMCVENQGCVKLQDDTQHCYEGNIYTYSSRKGWETKPIKCECTPNAYKCDNNTYYQCESKALNPYNWEAKANCNENIYNNKLKCDINYKGCVAAEDITCKSLNKEEIHGQYPKDDILYTTYDTDKFRMGPYLVVCVDNKYILAKEICDNSWIKDKCGDDSYHPTKDHNRCVLTNNKFESQFTYYPNPNKKTKYTQKNSCNNNYCALYNTYTRFDGCVSKLDEGKYNVAMDKCAIYVRDINERTKWITLVKWCDGGEAPNEP